MYLSIEETASFLELPVETILRLMREGQIRYHIVEDTPLIYKNQFNLFLKQREKAIREYQDYLNTPLPDDPDIKDED